MLIAMAVHDTEENGRSWMTEKTLRSLAATVNLRWHRIVIVDNGSCDATQALYDLMADAGLTFDLIRNGENLGTAKAINKAWAKRAPGQHCVKMDNDVVIHQTGWVDLLEEIFERDPSIGICALKRKDLGEHPGGRGRMKSKLRMLPHEPGQRWLVVEEVEGVMGTCQGFSSALLDEIGFLKQPGLYGYDDALVSYRSRAAGFKNTFLPGVEIDHIDPGGDAYCAWKIAQATAGRAEFDRLVTHYLTTGAVYYGGP